MLYVDSHLGCGTEKYPRDLNFQFLKEKWIVRRKHWNMNYKLGVLWSVLLCGIGINFKVFLTQRCMLPLKDGNMIVYSDGLSHKLWQSQGDMLHQI